LAAPTFSIGVDYGTNSVRALVVETSTGEEVACTTFDYPSGDQGVLLSDHDVNLARQNPADIVQGFRVAVAEAVREAERTSEFSVDQVIGIGSDTTGSSPLPVDASGTPLISQSQYSDDLAAQIWLWKDHTAHQEAEDITQIALETGEPYLAKCGGTYSSEWFWSKVWKCAKDHPDVFAAAHSWMELADFVPYQITGATDLASFPRSVCPAGHKAMYSESWGGLPSNTFLDKLNPKLTDLRQRLYDVAVPADQRAGGLSVDFAEATGLRPGTPVAVGIMDAHAGAVGSGCKPGTLVKIMGTSTCDVMVQPKDRPLADIPGVCGIVDGSVIPGMIGIEAGQSAVGDLFNWFVRFMGDGQISHDQLSAQASQLRPGESGLLALDWQNGNRTILVDARLSGLIVGLSLQSNPAEVYRALIEATAFGARTIIDRVREYGVPIAEIVTGGGIAEKNPMAMQIYADVLGMPIRLARSSQACALGAAIFGSVVGGAHRDVLTAQKAMTGLKSMEYTPNPDAQSTYNRLYSLYRNMHDSFGGVVATADLSEAMKTLLNIRDEVRQ
jgi:L-ribulokinase